MAYWPYLLAFGAGAGIILAWLCRVGRRQKAYNHQEFLRKLDSLLQPKEAILVLCPQKGGCCVLTNQRMLLEKRGTFQAFPLSDLRSVQGKNKGGNRTTVPGNMVTLTVKFQQTVILRNTGSAFIELTKHLQDTVKRRSQQKKSPRKKK